MFLIWTIMLVLFNDSLPLKFVFMGLLGISIWTKNIWLLRPLKGETRIGTSKLILGRDYYWVD